MVAETHEILQTKVAMIAVPVLIVFCVIAIASSFAYNDHRHRKLLVGSIGLGVSIAMYSSPLVAMVSHLCLPPASFSSNILFSVKTKHRNAKPKQGNRVVPSQTIVS